MPDSFVLVRIKVIFKMIFSNLRLNPMNNALKTFIWLLLVSIV